MAPSWPVDSTHPTQGLGEVAVRTAAARAIPRRIASSSVILTNQSSFPSTYRFNMKRYVLQNSVGVAAGEEVEGVGNHIEYGVEALHRTRR